MRSRLLVTASISLLVVIAAIGCSSDSKVECSDSQVEVAYLGGARDGETVCKPIPAACGATASCAAQPCIAAMYGFCEAPYIGVGCSDTFPPPIISCND